MYFCKKISMNLKDNHQWVCIRLFVSALFVLSITALLSMFVSVESFSVYQRTLGFIIGGSNLIASIYFYFQFSIEPSIEVDATDNMARNAYLLSIILFFTGLITLSSTASRVANFFILIGTLSLLVAHILYFIKIKSAIGNR